MNDRQAESIKQAVMGSRRRWYDKQAESETGAPFDLSQQDCRNRLQEEVRTEVQNRLSGVDEEDFSRVLMLCALGPRGAPPEKVRNEFKRAVEARCPKPDWQDRAWEYAVAYGCGWGRTVSPGPGGWEDIWPGSVETLTRLTVPHVRRVNRWLHAPRVVNFPHRGQEEFLGDAGHLSARLCHWRESAINIGGDRSVAIHVDDGTRGDLEARVTCEDSNGAEYESDPIPAGSSYVATLHGKSIEFPPKRRAAKQGRVKMPDGARLVIGAGDDMCHVWCGGRVGKKTDMEQRKPKGGDELRIEGVSAIEVWSCACGNVCGEHACPEHHRLEAWIPDEKPFEWFLASAVRGPMNRIMMNSLENGMYLPFLARWEFDS